MAGLLQNKVALITGGGGGIGRATSLIFAREGAKIVISDMSVKGGEETVKMIKQAGGEAYFIKTDVRIENDVKGLIANIADTYGRLDCAFNNAGVFRNAEMNEQNDRITKITETQWDFVINTNMKGVWLCMKHELPLMVKQGKGAIVNSSSLNGLFSFPSGPAYAASKSAIISLTKTAALEHATDGIRVNAICPGSIDTPMNDPFKPKTKADEQGWVNMIKAMIPLGRWGYPSEVGEVVAWLCSDAASYITGIAMPIDGGWAAHA